MFPAGTYLLRKTLYIPSRVSLVGDGPATVLGIRPLQVAYLAKDIRKGGRVLTCKTEPPFRVGEGIGVCDDKHRGWWGTHGEVERVVGNRVWMSVPFNRRLLARDNARVVNLFPCIWAEGETDIEIRDLTIKGPEDYAGDWWDFTYSAVHIVGCERVARSELFRCFGWPSDGFWDFSAVAMPRWRIVRRTGVAGMGFIPERGWRAVCGHTISGRAMGAMGIIFCARVHHSVCSDSVFFRKWTTRDWRCGKWRGSPQYCES